MSQLNLPVVASALAVGLLLMSSLAAQSARSVSTTLVKRSRLERKLVVQADVLPIARMLCIPRVTGYVDSIPVEEGQVVAKAAPLVRIDSPELEVDRLIAHAELKKAEAHSAVTETTLKAALQAIEVARAEIQAVESQLSASEVRNKLAKIEHKRTETLHKKRAATEEQLDRSGIAMLEAEAMLHISRAAILSAKAKLVATKAMAEVKASEIEQAKAEVDMAKASLQRSETIVAWAVIKNPYTNALVTKQLVDPGNLVLASKTAVLEIMDVSRVRIRFPVPELDAALVRAGSSVRLVRSGTAIDDVLAKVTRVSGALDPMTRTMAAEIVLDNPEREWMPGSLCRVVVLMLAIDDAVMIPNKALVKKGADAFVWTVESGHAKRVLIKLGVDVGKSIQVLSGLKGGEQMIVTGHSGLREGEAVSAKSMEGGS